MSVLEIMIKFDAIALSINISLVTGITKSV
jgi:hypothetical protein